MPNLIFAGAMALIAILFFVIGFVTTSLIGWFIRLVFGVDMPLLAGLLSILASIYPSYVGYQIVFMMSTLHEEDMISNDGKSRGMYRLFVDAYRRYRALKAIEKAFKD